MLRFAFALTLLTIPGGLTPRLVAAEFDPKAVDAIVATAMEFFHVPGAAVAIVRDDEAIYQKGFGIREYGKPDLVTPETLFPIASMSKAFAATSLAMLVADGKLNWDDPVRKHLPSFRLSDPTADREVTVRDLLCHRTGLPRHDKIWDQPWDRAELVRRCAFLPATEGFRAKYQYNNLMFTTAGVVAESITGKTWEEVVRDRLFQPLGMTASNFSVRDLQKTSDFARGHRRTPDGKTEIIPYADMDAMCPAGGVNSNIRDLTRWVRFQMGGGKIGDTRVLSARVHRDTHTPITVVPPPPLRVVPEDVSHLNNYALGWNVADYRGLRLVAHSGSIDGFTSVVMLVPEKKFGVVVLNNRQQSPLPQAVAYRVIDTVLGLADMNWNKRYQDVIDQQKAIDDKQTAERMAKRKKDTKPSLSLDEYVGEYDNAGYGTITVVKDGEKLSMKYSRDTLPLDHFHYDTFHIPPRAEEIWSGSWGDRLLTFRLNAHGEVESTRILGQDFIKKK